MPNIVKYNLSTSPNSIQSGNFNIGVNNTPTNLSEFYTGICPIIGGYTIYINKASNGPSIYAPKNDTQLIEITNNLGGNVTTAEGALVWLNSQSTMTVLNNNYPSIVTSGLSINLDAAFVSSYPKTGTTWSDLGGNDINASLVNGPTFDSSNYGSIVFDGVNDVCTLPINTFTSGSPQNGTFILKFKTPPFDNTTTNILFRDGGSTGNLIYFYRNAAWATNTYAWLIYTNENLAKILYDEYLPNEWYETAFTFDSQGNVKSYINGVLRDSETWGSATSWKRSGSILPNLRSSSPSGTGNIQRFMYYTRALSGSEILQNYNAGLQRFIPTSGLTLSLDAQNTNLYATSPTTAYDVSGNENNGTLINGTQYSSQGDGSFYFDGTNDAITTITSPSLESITTGTSICFWVKLGSIANNYASFFTKSGLATNLGIRGNDGFTIWYSSLGNWVAGYSGPSGQRVLNNGNWYFMCYTYDGASQKIYNNGSQILSRNVTGNFTTTSNSMVISNSSFNGWLGVSYIYNRALTQAEISTIYNATKSRYGIQ